MRRRLRRRAFLAAGRQALGSVAAFGLGANQAALRLVEQNRLRPRLLLEVLDLLGPRQQSRLLRIGRIEAHRELADGMPFAGHDHFAVGEAGAGGERRVEIGRGVDALEPVAEQRGQARVAEMQQIGQARQGAMLARDRRRGRGEERHPGRRRIGGECAHRVEPADLERAQALAQRCLERRLPAGLDPDPAPQAGQRFEAVPGEPRLQLVFDLNLFLERLQRPEPGREIGVAVSLVVGRGLERAPRLVERRHALLPLGEARFGGVVLGLDRGGALPGGVELRGVDRCQTLFFRHQAIAPALGLGRLLVDATHLGGGHLDLLLHAGDDLALAIAGRLRLAQRRQGGVDSRGVLGDAGGEAGGRLLGRGDPGGDAVALGARLGLPGQPGAVLDLEIGALPGDPLSAFGDIADPLLEPADVERRFAERALRRMQGIVGFVVRLADRFELGLGMTQLGGPRFERRDRGDDRGLHPLLLTRRVAMLEEPELVLLERAVLLQRAIAAGDLGLRLELGQIEVELAQDVLDAGQVLARVLEPVLGLAPPFLVFRDPGRLLEEEAQLLRLALDDSRDRALADDRVGARSEAGAEEHVLNVAAAHRLVVDVVAARAVARQHALDGDLGEAVPGPARPAGGVVEGQLDAGAPGGLAQARAVEDHVLHRLAAQLAGLAFAEHPAHRVDDVRLAAAVRADDADELAGELELGRFDERLEARELDRVETHGRRRGGEAKLLI